MGVVEYEPYVITLVSGFEAVRVGHLASIFISLHHRSAWRTGVGLGGVGHLDSIENLAYVYYNSTRDAG